MNSKILLFILISFSTSFSQELLILEKAIEIALKNNFSIIIAQNQREIAENNFSLGNAGFLPGINAEGSYSESDNNTRQEYIDGRIVDRSGAKSDNLNASITLNWTIFDGLGMFANYTALKELKEIGETNYRIIVENNIADIISTYYNLVRQRLVQEVISRSLAISEERVKLADAKRDVGSASKFELLQAQVDLNEDRSLLLRAELNFSQSKTILNQLMGRDPSEDFSISDSIIVKKGFSFDDLKTAASNQNAEIFRALQNRNVSDAQLRLTRADLFPEISLFGSYNFLRSESQAGFISSNQNTGFTYGVRASLNLFNGLNTRRQIENAQIEIQISELEFGQVKNRVESELQNAFKLYQNSLTLIELETANLKVTEENVDIALEKLRLGNITQLEFREAQIDLIDAQSRLVNAQYEAKSAETELLRISGQLVKN